ncbi:MAG: thioredoxin family protein [Candidatus Bathyarchaeota archaeon]
MSEIEDIDAAQLDSYVEKGKPVLLLIWRKGCDQCRRFKPVFNQLPQAYPEATFLNMSMFNSMENLRLAEKYEKDMTPITLVFCKGILLGTFVGYYSLLDFRSKLGEVFEKNQC